MILGSRFDIGDTVYAVSAPNHIHTRHSTILGPLTISQIRVEFTNSPGRPGEKTFDNYMPQKGRKEHYMCVETGVGTGALYPVERLCASYEEAQQLLEHRRDDSR